MNIEKETQSIKLNSGKAVNSIKSGRTPNAALTRAELAVLHLMPTSDPVAFTLTENGSLKFYFSPDNVTTTPPELWYPEGDSEGIKPITLTDGTVIPYMDRENAESMGYHTHEALESMHLTVVEAPVAYMHRVNDEGTERDGIEYLYDIRTCVRSALKCARCGKEDRFRSKLCRKCYEKDMLKRRKAGDAYRASVTGIDRGRAIFFDLELTGVYPYDEIISVSITDGWGNEIMDTLVRPEKRRQWNITVKIHGITPKMTKYAPSLAEVTPRIKEILLGAEIIVAYGISTDYSHIKEIFTEKERELLLPKLRDCAKEYVRYISEYEPDINKSSLVSATEYFGIEWSGTAHTSMADTHSCRILWEKLFPSCYKDAAENNPEETELIRAVRALPDVSYITFDEAFEKAKLDTSPDPQTRPRQNSQRRKQNQKSGMKSQKSNASGTAKGREKPKTPVYKAATREAVKSKAQEESAVSEKKPNGIKGFFRRFKKNK